MNFCHEFQGLGKTFDKENLKEVYQVCREFGLVKNRRVTLKKKWDIVCNSSRSSKEVRYEFEI